MYLFDYVEWKPAPMPEVHMTTMIKNKVFIKPYGGFMLVDNQEKKEQAIFNLWDEGLALAWVNRHV